MFVYVFKERHKYVFVFTDPVRRCRNEGGHDLTWCSAVDKYPNDPDTTKQYDLVCGEYKPTYQVCHLSALNGEGNEPHFSFTRFPHFNEGDARKVCNAIGGHLPSLQEELQSIWLQKAMEDLLSFVSVGWPFSIKWLTWPVSNIIGVTK